MESIKIMVVDDEKTILIDIDEYFEEYDLDIFSDPVLALSQLEKCKYDIIVTDYKMPGLSGLEFLMNARKKNGYSYGILLTAYADKELLEEAINNNLISMVLEKPLVLKKLKVVLRRAIKECGKLKNEKEWYENIQLRYEELQSHYASSKMEIIGLNSGLKRVYKKALSIAGLRENILITGETGTGKELFARLIHELSDRQDSAFVVVNCAAIPHDLLESELFGHKKGAFTGAAYEKVGKMELAHNGTLFLDEIGDMNHELQAKVLRAIQEKKIERVGDSKIIKTNFRLISATNKDLGEAVEEREFREDLYYRINTFPVEIPPLRERRDDIKKLVFYYINKFCTENQLKKPAVDDEALLYLAKCRWPGNIRQLVNIVKQAVVNGGNKDILRRQDFSFLISPQGKGKNRFYDAVNILKDMVIDKECELKEIESAILQSILEHFDANVSEAVQNTDISKDRFYRSRKKIFKRIL